MSKDLLIAKRDHPSHDFNNLVPIKIGMGLTSRINDDFEIINKESPALPYPNFAYIVAEIKENFIILIDTQNNNSWTISHNELNKLELIREFHSQNSFIDFDRVNDVLSR